MRIWPKLKEFAKALKKQKGEKYCKNFMGFVKVQVRGEEKEIVESCTNRCKAKIKEV